MHPTPVSLLERLRKPHEVGAWDHFVELYSPLLYHWARRLGQQESDAADLVQDVFLLLWRRLPSFEYDASRSFHAWLRTLFLNRLRQRSRQRVQTVDDVSISRMGDDGQADALERQEYQHYLLHRAFQLIEREFSSQHVTAFREYALEGRPVEEVASRLQLSVGTVYCIKSRIVNRLRQELACLLD